MSIYFYNRYKQMVEKEEVYGNLFIQFLYAKGNPLSEIMCKKPLSFLYGALQDLPSSAKKIEKFCKRFQISLEDFLPEEGAPLHKPYSTFNSFFIRRYKDGLRPFVQDENLPAPAEGRYAAYLESTREMTVKIKGTNLSISSLLQNKKWTSLFEKGPVLIARLCPVDYHRYHFPDNGRKLDQYRISGPLHSVNPYALRKKENILFTNERKITIIESENFGRLALIEVGATFVGRMVESHRHNHFKRGDEKGYFLFGGSTVVILGEHGRFAPSSDLIENTQKGLETFVKLGDQVGLTF